MVSECSQGIADYLESVQQETNTSKEPSYHQYANRLIEWVDSGEIVDTYSRYDKLVSEGVEPEHAFVMVTRINWDC